MSACKETCHSGCNHANIATQSLDEMEFERGIWSAAMYGEVDKIEKLLHKSKEDVNRTDNYGYTALHYAARNGQLEACKYLVRNGAKVNVQTKELNATPLHRAASVGNEAIVEFLLGNGADLSLKDSDGKTALDRAQENGKTSVVRLLTKTNF